MLPAMTTTNQGSTAAPATPPASSASAPAGTPPAGQQQTDELPPRDWAGIALDVAGVAAAAVLVVIIIDVWTEGKLSGWWRARRAARGTPAPE